MDHRFDGSVFHRVDLCVDLVELAKELTYASTIVLTIHLIDALTIELTSVLIYNRRCWTEVLQAWSLLVALTSALTIELTARLTYVLTSVLTIELTFVLTICLTIVST